MMTAKFEETVETLCKDWTGCSLREIPGSMGRMAQWKAGACMFVCPACEIDKKGHFVSGDASFFSGVRISGDKKDDGYAGVWVRLHDSYGNIVVRVDTVGMSYGKLTYYSQFNEMTEVSVIVDKIRSLVEVVGLDLAREVAHCCYCSSVATRVTPDDMKCLIKMDGDKTAKIDD